VGGQDAHRLYRRQGFGQRMGFGEHPAVLVIDMQRDFVDEDAPSTVAPASRAILVPIQRLCAAARERGLPVVYTRGVVSADGLTEGLWRLKSRAHAEGRVQVEGTPGAEIVAELAPRPGDIVITKRRPSAFFCTDLEVYLRRLHVDTLLVCGTSISGCVRATVTDAFMRDLRAMVIRDCVADRAPEIAEANLFDLDQKYADVVTLEEVLTYLDRFPRRAGLTVSA